MMVVIWLLLGLVMGVVINVLADDLPRRERPHRPCCPQCGHEYGVSDWWAIGRRLWGNGRCPNCDLPSRLRPILVEVSTLLLFPFLPLLIIEPVNLVFTTLYVTVFILVIVIDLEHRLILNVVTYPITVVALLASFLVTDNNFRFAALGALVGFAFFFLTYWLGQWLFGPGALGFGDVKLAMAMGAMLGLHRVMLALTFGILLGGVVSAALLLSRRFQRRNYLPYGQYLALAAISMQIWGCETLAWYTDMAFTCEGMGSILQ